MIQSVPETMPSENATSCDKMDINVVVLNNYFRAHHSAVYREVHKRVSNLKILLSTPMEANRSWDAEWGDLDVSIQKNWTFTTKWRYSGFVEDNFIHVPVDTIKQLKTLRPDIVFSYEMGFRTLLSSFYCRKRKIPLVMVGNMSDLIERERGAMRKRFRKFLRNRVDYCTYNGPSCKRYLMDLGVSEDRLIHFPYAFDEDKIYRGPVQTSQDGVLRLVFCGVLDLRKGLALFLDELYRWCEANPNQPIELSICGTGENDRAGKESGIPSLKVNWLGHCDSQRLAAEYARADICVFPTLADEWGLVPIESLASGTPVLGSRYAQSVESLIEECGNGWSYCPDDSQEFYSVLDKALTTDPTILKRMAHGCRDTVKHISPANSADYFVKAIRIARGVIPDS